jgi:hypothetical protein
MTPAEEIASILARHPRLVRTNTPLEVLAEHMIESLALFESSLLERAKHPFFRPGAEPNGC